MVDNVKTGIFEFDLNSSEVYHEAIFQLLFKPVVFSFPLQMKAPQDRYRTTFG